jgi:hypothetical protein
VLLFFVPVVGEHGAELVIRRRLDTLIVPIDGLQLFHQGDDRSVSIDRLGW